MVKTMELALNIGAPQSLPYLMAYIHEEHNDLFRKPERQMTGPIFCNKIMQDVSRYFAEPAREPKARESQDARQVAVPHAMHRPCELFEKLHGRYSAEQTI